MCRRISFVAHWVSGKQVKIQFLNYFDLLYYVGFKAQPIRTILNNHYYLFSKKKVM